MPSEFDSANDVNYYYCYYYRRRRNENVRSRRNSAAD